MSTTPRCAAERLGRDLSRYQALQADTAALETQLKALLAVTEGQVLTSLPGVAVVRASAFAAYSQPISRFPDSEHLCSATGLAPALYTSATVKRRGRISRQGLAEHRDVLRGIAWGLSRYSPPEARPGTRAARSAPARASDHVSRTRPLAPRGRERFRRPPRMRSNTRQERMPALALPELRISTCVGRGGAGVAAVRLRVRVVRQNDRNGGTVERIVPISAWK